MAPSQPEPRRGALAAARRHHLRFGKRRPSPGGRRGAGRAQLGQGRVLAPHAGCGAQGLRGREDLHLHARTCGPPAEPAPQEVHVARVADWAATERQVVDGFFRFSPAHARFMGDHRFDGVVGDLSKTAIRARVSEIDEQLSTIGAVQRLDRGQAIDQRALIAQLAAARFELTELRLPFREPMFYAGPSELDVSSYLKRPYAPLGDGLTARLATADQAYALGEDHFLRLLGLRELVQLDVPTLERMVRADIDRNRSAAEAAAEEIAAGAGVPAAVARLEDHHPTATSIIADVTAMLGRLRAFLVERDVVSLPSNGRCLVQPTPSYAAYISAAMDSAGPLEMVATDSYYWVTVPGAHWDAAKSEEWLRYMNY